MATEQEQCKKSHEQKEPCGKKCLCSRCFLPIEHDDRVDIEGKPFHKICSMCCICRNTPKALKMFYGHVFCEECFKTHILNHFKGASPQVNCNMWWMQWNPMAAMNSCQGCTDQNNADKCGDAKPCFCTRCSQPILTDADKVLLNGQCYHCNCAKCYGCQKIPTGVPKIYYGQIFCEDCFNKLVLKQKDTPAEFFRSCFEQWRNNTQFGEYMKEFMETTKSARSPTVFVMPPSIKPCRDGKPEEWKAAPAEDTKSVTPASVSFEDTSTWDSSEQSSSSNKPSVTFAAQNDVDETKNSKMDSVEKIEKLTKYLNKDFGDARKWGVLKGSNSTVHGWIDLQEMARSEVKRGANCPKCFWRQADLFM